MLRIRDAIKTRDNLFFSVVSYHHPADRYIAFLRYYPSPEGDRIREGRVYKKVESTEFSYVFLKSEYPYYIFYSDAAGSELQCVPTDKVEACFYPNRRLSEITENPKDALEKTAAQISEIFDEIPLEKKGVTGSLLFDFHRPDSDIDFVIYGAKNFEKARKILGEADSTVRELSIEEWRDMYNKRIRGSTISFEEFLWHENRKHHKAAIGDVIFDVLFVKDQKEITGKYSDLRFKRVGKFKGQFKVLDASLAFDYPAIYEVAGETEGITEVASYTHTYAGQAQACEEIEVSGILEEVSGKKNFRRIVVGTTREAHGEYIKVKK